jgi:hypothetical protein
VSDAEYYRRKLRDKANRFESSARSYEQALSSSSAEYAESRRRYMEADRAEMEVAKAEFFAAQQRQTDDDPLPRSERSSDQGGPKTAAGTAGLWAFVVFIAGYFLDFSGDAALDAAIGTFLALWFLLGGLGSKIAVALIAVVWLVAKFG